MKINYNLKKGDIIRGQYWNTKDWFQLKVTSTNPKGIVTERDTVSEEWSYEDLESMNVELVSSSNDTDDELTKFQDLSEYIDDPKELMYFIRALCGVAKLRHRESQDPKWVELEKQLRAILDS